FDQAAPISARPTKTRWLGALSLVRLVSRTMRTPLAWTLRVTISPWNSLPDFLNEPMVAMSFLLGCSSPRPSRPRWRSEGRTRSRPHPLGPEHSGGWRRRDFLGSRGMGAAGVPALAGWQAQGKKVSPPPLRQGDRGLPSCGPITPSRGRAGRRARQPCEGKWRTWVCARGQAKWAKEQKPWRAERPPSHPDQAQRSPSRDRGCWPRTACRSIDALRGPRSLTVRFDDPHPPITQPKL